MRHVHARRRAGFTILEVILALGILLIGMTAVLGILTLGGALTRSAQLRTESASATAAVVADLEETLFPLVDGEVGPPRVIVDRALPGSGGVVYSAHATPNPARANEYRVDVELSWSSAGVRRARSFRTILLAEVPFGERLRQLFVDGARPVAPAPTPATTPGAAETPPAKGN